MVEANLIAADKVPEPTDHKKTKTASPKEDFPAARQDASARPDEYQCSHLGSPAQEKHKLDQEQSWAGAEGAGD